jgi:hypothetical protein
MLQSQSFRAICALNAGDSVTSRNIIQQCIHIYGFCYEPLFHAAPAVEARLRSQLVQLANTVQSAPQYAMEGSLAPPALSPMESIEKGRPADVWSSLGGAGAAGGLLHRRLHAPSHCEGACVLGMQSPAVSMHVAAAATDEAGSSTTTPSAQPVTRLAPEAITGADQNVGDVAVLDSCLPPSQSEVMGVEGRAFPGTGISTCCKGSMAAAVQLEQNVESLMRVTGQHHAQTEGSGSSCRGTASACQELNPQQQQAGQAAGGASGGAESLNSTAVADGMARALSSDTAGPSRQSPSRVCGQHRLRSRRLDGVELKYDDLEGAMDFERFHESELLVRLQAHLMAQGLSISNVMEMLRMRMMEIHMQVCRSIPVLAHQVCRTLWRVTCVAWVARVAWVAWVACVAGVVCVASVACVACARWPLSSAQDARKRPVCPQDSLSARVTWEFQKHSLPPFCFHITSNQEDCMLRG